MKNLQFALLLLAFGATLPLRAQPAAKTAFGAEMVAILNNMKAHTLEIVRQMPEDRFDFKPVDEVRSFREQAAHIATVIDFQTHYVLGLFPFNNDVDALRGEFGKIAARNQAASKEELSRLLEKRFDEAAVKVAALSKKDLKRTFHFFFLPGQPTRSLMAAVMGLRDHITHHRGQMVVYLRLNGIEPAQYQSF